MPLRLIIFLGLASVVRAAEGRPPCVSVETLFFPTEIRRILAESDLFQTAIQRAKFPEAQKPGDFEDVVSKSIVDARREKLLQLLFTDETYSWPDTILADGTVKSRAISWRPSWNVRVQAKKGGESVEVYFSFFHMVCVCRNGVLLGGAFMGTKSAELLALFREIFPEDERLLRAEKWRTYQRAAPLPESSRISK